MSYVERALTAGETVKFKAKIHWIIWLRAWAALILFGVLLFGIVSALGWLPLRRWHASATPET